MKLKVGERIRLLGILPEKGNLLILKIVRTLRDELSFSEDEHKTLKIVVEGNRITWDDNAEAKKVEFGDEAKKLVEKCLRDLDKKDELTFPDIVLWDKFIGEE
jgi:hypothetical protein